MKRCDCYRLTLTNHEGIVVETWHVQAGDSACQEATNVTKAIAAADLIADVRQAVINDKVC